ncbi:hypothetical protein MMPV_002372 [Pyropia vietnamensis]
MNGVGVAGLRAAAARRAALSATGATAAADAAAALSSHASTFTTELAKFASAHRADIEGNPAFRERFHALCATVGVDPLTSTKGVWGRLLGVGAFYAELSVRLVGVCATTRSVNGGLLRMDELVALLNRRVGSGGGRAGGERGGGGAPSPRATVTADDVRRAVKRLASLGGGYAVDRIGGVEVVRSVPGELSRDAGVVAGLAMARRGMVTAASVAATTGWGADRTATALRAAVEGGFAWVDDGGRERSYWFLGLAEGGGEDEGALDADGHTVGGGSDAGCGGDGWGIASRLRLPLASATAATASTVPGAASVRAAPTTPSASLQGSFAS